jgi:hypothetical protein
VYLVISFLPSSSSKARGVVVAAAGVGLVVGKFGDTSGFIRARDVDALRVNS